MKFPLTFTINPCLFTLLVLGFVFATIIGTVTHETGHYIPAKCVGYNPRLSYAFVAYSHATREQMMVLDSLYRADEEKILSKENSPQKTFYLKYRESISESYVKPTKFQAFIITLGGPVQTMLTGTIGILLLWLYRKKLYTGGRLKVTAWFSVFLSFFWSRQVFNFLMSLPYIFKKRTHYRSDEPKISLYLNLPHWVFGMATAVVGAVLLTWVVFYILPKQQRLTFLCAGLVGSALGWYLWMDILGPVVLP